MQDNWLNNIVLVSIIHLHESAIGIHMSLSSWTSLLSSTPSRLQTGSFLHTNDVQDCGPSWHLSGPSPHICGQSLHFCGPNLHLRGPCPHLYGPSPQSLWTKPASLWTMPTSLWTKSSISVDQACVSVDQALFSVQYAAAAGKSLQSCLTLCDPIDGSPPGSPIPGILQARVLKWAAISFSKAWKWKVKVKSLSCVWLLAMPWTAAYQALLPMGFSRQEYWSGVPLPSLSVQYTFSQSAHLDSHLFMETT